MHNFSSLRKQATEKFSSSSANSKDPAGQQESKSSTGIFNIPGSSKVTKTFGNIGNKNTVSQVPEQSAPLPTSPANQNTVYSPLHHPHAAPQTSTSSPPLPPGPLNAFSGYPPPPTNPTSPPLSSNPSYDTGEAAQRFSQASPPEPGPLYSSEHTLVAPHEIPQDSPISPRIGDSPSPRPEMERKKGSFGYPFSKSKDKNFDAESERSLLTPTTPQGSTKSSKPQFSVKIPKALRGMANLSELEVDFTGGEVSIVSDTKKKQRKEGLCTACSKIGWEQFVSPELSPRGPDDEKLTRKLIFLDRILRKKKKDSCHFCTLIFDAIVENDPFNHPAVKDHLPAQLAGMTFKKWADSLNFAQHLPLYKAAYPFGRSRDNVKLQQESQGEEVVVEGSIDNDEFTGDDAAKIGSAAAVGALNVGIWTDTDLERVRIMATVGTIIPTLTTFMTGLDAKLPVAISLIIHNANSPDAGLINVDVWGYGNGHRAPLARISTFTLRIASGYQYSPDGALSYGNMLHPEYVNVEDDCGRWLDNCSKCHGESCEEPSWWNELEPPSGPHFKLIDVNDIRIVSKDIADLSGDERVKYAALSYVWGATGSQRLNLHVGNLEALRTTLENQDLPIARTIRDAIDVTRRMGLQYLWADSLCIVQRDGKGQDDPEARAQQIQQMDRIFGHATITIVAADGLHADAGLPGISTPAARSQIARVVQPNINVLLAIQYPNALGKWNTRAWTFQEKLLSKRMLIFNGGYVSFHCRHSVLREDMPATHAGNGPAQIPWVSEIPKKSSALIKRAWDASPVLLRSPFFTEYANLLAQYTSRDMTDSRDALNAVLGLLKVLEKMTIDKQKALHRISRAVDFGNPTDWTLHGLPEKFLDMALLWQPPAAKGVYLTRREHGDLPSWSWTGWEVGKDPEYDAGAVEGHAEKPGVRFEQPFWVSSNDDLSLKKVIADASDDKWPAEERLRPLVMWYKCTAPPTSHITQNEPGNPPILVPVNGHGLGLHFSAEDTEHLKTFQTAALRYRTHQGPPQIKPDVPLATHHLICETLTAKFRVRRTKPRQETLWKRSTKGLVIDSELFIPEAGILDTNDVVIGKFILTDQRKGLSSSLYDFVLLSEAQYWGDEERVDVVGFPLFNVMVVAWDLRREFATRIGVGKVLKTAWWAAEPVVQTIILK